MLIGFVSDKLFFNCTKHSAYLSGKFYCICLEFFFLINYLKILTQNLF